MNYSQALVFRTTHRAKFEEIDPFGHLNVNHYLSYFSENRFQGQREMLGLRIKDLAKVPIAFHTGHIEMDFQKPVFLDDAFIIESKISDVTEKSCVINSTMSKPDDQEYVHATAKFIMVCVDKKTGKPTAWPENFIRQFFNS